MAQIPADAQRSEDGQWWWDGSQWQPVGDQGAGASAASPAASSQPGQSDAGQSSTPASGQLSDDGQWQWDGAQWQPAQGGGQPGGGAQPGDQGAAAGGAKIDPSEFPTLAALSQSNPNDFDSYLTSIGMDPRSMEEGVA